MLIEFYLKNYRSFRDETYFSAEATSDKTRESALILHNKERILPVLAIYGKNGGGKSNVIRAFWLATSFICNAQRMQHDSATIPVTPFLLDDTSKNEPTSFQFTYVQQGIKYIYGFTARKENIVEEHLFHYPNKSKAVVFERNYQEFHFKSDKKMNSLIAGAVAENQLFFAVATTMKHEICIAAMGWFREQVTFSRDFTDIPLQLIAHAEDKNMLSSIKEYAKKADIGILDMDFEVDNTVLEKEALSDDMPEDMKTSLSTFMQALSKSQEVQLQQSPVKVTSYHQGRDKNGNVTEFPLDLSLESDGTLRLMALAPVIEKTLRNGGVLLVDEIEKEIHPLLLEYIILKFQNPNTNHKGAQLFFTTHNTELLAMDLLRKDQVYFVDKSREEGVSELYTVEGSSKDLRVSYLMGKYGAIPSIEEEMLEK